MSSSLSKNMIIKLNRDICTTALHLIWSFLGFIPSYHFLFCNIHKRYQKTSYWTERKNDADDSSSSYCQTHCPKLPIKVSPPPQTSYFSNPPQDYIFFPSARGYGSKLKQWTCTVSIGRGHCIVGLMMKTARTSKMFTL
jgi:hypothetical protein